MPYKFGPMHKQILDNYLSYKYMYKQYFELFVKKIFFFFA